MQAASLLSRTSIAVEIRGYTDSQGEADYNLRLSQRRAEAVMNYLINQGIVANRMRALGLGEGNPIDSNDTESGQARNRRVEFISIIGED